MTPEERREHCRKIGSLGGRKTAAKPGHMSQIGKKGFKALCRKFPGNSRSLALHHLGRKGAVVPRYIPHQEPEDGADFEAALAEIQGGAGTELPF